jgi:hypothetical protein
MNFIKTLITAILFSTPTVVLASTGAESEGSSFLLWLFLGFGALIVIFQSVPGLLLLYSMIKGILSPAMKKEAKKL